MKLNVPVEACTLEEVEKVGEKEVIPVPTVFLMVPLLTKATAPPPARLITWSFWMSQMPVLTITHVGPGEQVWMLPTPVHVVVPLVVRWRPPVRTLVGPDTDSAPLKAVVPTPPMKPPLQVEAPEAVT